MEIIHSIFEEIENRKKIIKLRDLFTKLNINQLVVEYIVIDHEIPYKISRVELKKEEKIYKTLFIGINKKNQKDLSTITKDAVDKIFDCCKCCS